MRQSRTIVIGLDALDLRLVEQWGAAGELPCLTQLLAGSPLVKLSTPSRVLQGSVWPSVLTGVSPGRHGLYLQQQLKNGTYALTETYADHVRLKKFYQHLGDAGVSCGVADIPADHPVRDIRGLQVVEWAPEFSFWRYETVPRSFARYIRTHIGLNPLTHHTNSGDSQQSHTELCAILETSTQLKVKLGKYLIGRKDLDLVFLVFGEAHKAGHWLWKYYDAQHPNHESCAPVLQQGLLNSYRQIDRAVAELISLVAADDNLIVFADHGMQAAYRGDHLVEPILERMQLLLPRSDFVPAAAASSLRAQAGRLYGRGKSVLRRHLPRGLAAALSRRRDSFPGIDWSRTRAFQLPTDRNSHIRINLEGREPLGIVRPGADYHSLLDQIEAGFRALINPLTGGAAVEEVFRCRELFPGECSEDLPDVSILWSAAAPLDEVYSPALGHIRLPVRELRSGNHRAEGFLLARGPRFRAGPGEYQGHILQIAPTLLYLHGVAIPEQYEMAPLAQILRPTAG